MNYLLAVQWVLLAVGLGYQHNLEWPLVCSCNGGCCGACQADRPLRAGEKLLCSGHPWENAANCLVLAGHQGWCSPALEHAPVRSSCCLGSANMNYKIVVVRRVMLGEAALLCAAAQLESVNDARGVEDLLLFQVRLTDFLWGQNMLPG